eukprot:1156138-Pelagomonas_calceolata.AAC.2
MAGPLAYLDRFLCHIYSLSLVKHAHVHVSAACAWLDPLSTLIASFVSSTHSPWHAQASSAPSKCNSPSCASMLRHAVLLASAIYLKCRHALASSALSRHAQSCCVWSRAGGPSYKLESCCTDCPRTAAMTRSSGDAVQPALQAKQCTAAAVASNTAAAADDDEVKMGMMKGMMMMMMMMLYVCLFGCVLVVAWMVGGGGQPCSSVCANSGSSCLDEPFSFQSHVCSLLLLYALVRAHFAHVHLQGHTIRTYASAVAQCSYGSPLCARAPTRAHHTHICICSSTMQLWEPTLRTCTYKGTPYAHMHLQ